MEKSYIEIAGKRYRVECNWNAYAEFLRMSGRDSMSELVAVVGELRPSDTAGLMAASINEGERLDGRESHWTAESIGETANVLEIAQFIRIYSDQATAKIPADADGKKKEETQLGAGE